MRIETLKERIDNANAKIERKQGTIEKKMALIKKKTAKIVKLGCDPNRSAYDYRDNDEVFWLMIEVEHLREDIERNTSEIEELKANLTKYEAQMAGEIEREAVLLKDIPESMKRMQSELVAEWDEFDKAQRARMWEAKKTLPYKEFIKKYSYYEQQLMYKSDEQIHNSNMQDAKMLILNLYYRIKNITGEVVDWSGIHAAPGAQGMTTLNGIVTGKEGRARIESIFAGGYNIQRLHVRVLVHEI